MLKIKIVGVAGSVRKNSNTEILVKKALKAAESLGEVETEFISLAEKKVEFCRACFNCWRELGKCVIEDDVPKILEKLCKSDGMIFGSPVYYGTISAKLKALMDRCVSILLPPKPVTSFEWDKLKNMPLTSKLRNKVGGAVVVGGFRGGGHEYALSAIHHFFMINDMFVVVDGGIRTYEIHPHFGATALGIRKGEVLKDEFGVKLAESVGLRVAEATKIVKAGLGLMKP